MECKLVIAVDFDCTLVKESKYPSVTYELLPNAKAVIERLTNKGCKFILNTARFGWYRLPAIWFVKKKKIPITTHIFNKKEVADIYIDDRNLFCKKIDWLEIEAEINRILENK